VIHPEPASHKAARTGPRPSSGDAPALLSALALGETHASTKAMGVWAGPQDAAPDPGFSPTCCREFSRGLIVVRSPAWRRSRPSPASDGLPRSDRSVPLPHQAAGDIEWISTPGFFSLRAGQAAAPKAAPDSWRAWRRQNDPAHPAAFRCRCLDQGLHGPSDPNRLAHKFPIQADWGHGRPGRSRLQGQHGAAARAAATCCSRPMRTSTAGGGDSAIATASPSGRKSPVRSIQCSTRQRLPAAAQIACFFF